MFFWGDSQFCKVNTRVGWMGLMGRMGPMVDLVDEVDIVDEVDVVDVVDFGEFVVMAMRPFHLCCLGAGFAGPGNGSLFLAFTI